MSAPRTSLQQRPPPRDRAAFREDVHGAAGERFVRRPRGAAPYPGQGKRSGRGRRGASGEVTDVQRAGQLTPKGGMRHAPVPRDREPVSQEKGC